MEIYMKKFEECEIYQQEGGPGIEYRCLLPQGQLADLGVGLITLIGPTWTTINKHRDWEQVYLIISGSGIIKIKEKFFKVEGPMIFQIPYNTEHSVELAPGEKMQYIYINQFLKRKNIDRA